MWPCGSALLHRHRQCGHLEVDGWEDPNIAHLRADGNPAHNIQYPLPSQAPRLSDLGTLSRMEETLDSQSVEPWESAANILLCQGISTTDICLHHCHTAPFHDVHITRLLVVTVKGYLHVWRRNIREKSFYSSTPSAVLSCQVPPPRFQRPTPRHRSSNLSSQNNNLCPPSPQPSPTMRRLFGPRQ